MYNLFLTGEIKIGKSTILKKVLEKTNFSIGGYITERVTGNKMRSFIVKSLYDEKEKHIIANIHTKNESKEIFIDSFKTGLLNILDLSFKNRDLIVLDELGFMENDIEVFTSKVYDLLDSEKPIVGVLKDFDCEFLNNIRNRDDVIILEITRENRDTAVNEVISILRGFGVEFKDESFI